MGFSAPGKPKITGCRSPDKETFTCWWAPGSSDGQSTKHRLFYRKENSPDIHECPDYDTAGKNSCFFDKGHTSIWVSYNLTVVASNARGTTFSDPVEVDVMDIVQPHAPENVTVTMKEAESNPYFVIQWEPPHDADTRFGWITVKYELRITQEKANKTEDYDTDKKREFIVYSLLSGEVYVVQVRCRLDAGRWSEWSTPTFIEVPHYVHQETSIQIIIAIVTAFIFVVTVAVLTIKRKRFKYCLLPPVPAPKIRGFDAQLLKNGKPEEIFSALITQSFPPTVQNSDCLVECLVVYDSEEDLICKRPQEKQIQKISSDSAQDVCSSSKPIMGRSQTEMSGSQSENIGQLLQGQLPKDTCDKLHYISKGTKTRPGDISILQRAHNHYSTLEWSQQGIHLSQVVHHPNNHLDQNTINPQSNCNKKCNTDEKINIKPAGNPGYVDVEEEKQNSKIEMPTVEEQDYSKVSGIVNDSVIMLQKDCNVFNQGHHGESCTNQIQNVKKMDMKVPPTKSIMEPQGYVETAMVPFS
ncbi:prolactin receptor b [Chanos chanos]|uniref:Prolactin receptor n=1 Tax=Chanos chanos TaxID=29144 RepID=A0A6J2WTX2_CHACN|nr:prolactin receptor-like [Chanos chanos]